MCGMKCKKAKGHTDGHQIKENCHIMAAFRGIRYNKLESPCYDVCFTKENLEK